MSWNRSILKLYSVTLWTWDNLVEIAVMFKLRITIEKQQNKGTNEEDCWQSECKAIKNVDSVN